MAKSNSGMPPPPVPASPTTTDGPAYTSKLPFRLNLRKSSYPAPAAQQQESQSSMKRPATAHASSGQTLSPFSGPSASQSVTALPPVPGERPTTGNEAGHRPSRMLFLNSKASKSSTKLESSSPTVRRVGSDSATDLAGSDAEMTRVGRSRPRSGSYPEASTPSLLDEVETKSVRSEGDQMGLDLVPASAGEPFDKATHEHLALEGNNPPASAKSRKKFFITRSNSIRAGHDHHSGRSTNRNRSADNSTRKANPAEVSRLKTAPIGPDRDRSFGTMFNSATRNRSADRAADSEEDTAPVSKNSKKDKKGPSTSFSMANANGSGIFAAMRKTSQVAAGGIGRAGNEFMKKMKRSESVTTKELMVPDDVYALKVITLPLAEQTRITRIGKRLELSKDKTEFWMPALPWRCIDYLNAKGCEEEGIYRQPGSGVQVRHWQRRFDTELDIDLFDEEDLYDINIVASMFKAWLRDLPDEVLPQSVQAKIGKICSEHDQNVAPQILKDELSLLPPFNYYLLFAITCHLSLLQSYSEYNKMNFQNLCICFQPCLNVEMPIFHFLVRNWKQCWQGCWTEEAYLKEEYCIIDAHSSDVGTIPTSTSALSSNNFLDERALSSSDSKSTSSSTNIRKKDKHRPGPLSPTRSGTSSQQSAEQSSVSNGSTVTPGLYGKDSSQLPELEPIQPLSPML